LHQQKITNVERKTALVTGSTSGIGLGIAKALASAIAAVHRDEAGRLRVQLGIKANGQSESLAVSRLFAHLFKAM
jgi:NAD(P)-dependent dehydrogenase (short-subunit alcohol dehydrogenase family)